MSLTEVNIGDTVTCSYGDTLLKATIIGVAVKDKVPYYRVHYYGYKDARDEWVPHNRIKLVEKNSIEPESIFNKTII